ncbi:MAG: hypothetical protein QM784_29290 [Polyangiaceae bacterium]
MNPAAAPVWGIGRVLWYQELEENRGKLIDLDVASSDTEKEAERIFEELDSLGQDDEVGWRGHRRFTSRLKRIESLTNPCRRGSERTAAIS